MTVIANVDQEILIERARDGDRCALERLLLDCRPDLERYARRSCQSEDVEEAVQDALWILYRRLGGLRSVAAFTGWLFQVVRRICLQYARQKRPHVSLDHPSALSARDQSAVDAEARMVVTDILVRLPRPYREMLLLKDVQGYSADEAASRLCISLEAAKSRLHRGRALMREALAGNPVALLGPAGGRSSA